MRQSKTEFQPEGKPKIFSIDLRRNTKAIKKLTHEERNDMIKVLNHSKIQFDLFYAEAMVEATQPQE